MLNKKCERCGSRPHDSAGTGPKANEFTLFDYCAVCSKDLCPECMAKGCCGNVPALSGEKADNPD